MSTAAQGEFIIGNYRVGQTIGQGTFGKVRLGVHIPTEQKVAVKTLQKQKIVQQADIQRVTRQICILKILRHPNIVQLYQIIETKTDIHLIMEYACGGQLFDYIVKKKRLDEQEAIGFMQQILAGVEYIHKNGIVHRDLKPENLLFDENKLIKIVDFGLSNQYKPGQKLKTACGSPCYAAPEMIAGKRYECINVDIWSCGIILYAMLCGYLPFEDANTNKLYKKIMAGEYEQPKVLTPDSKEMLKNILNVNPQARLKITHIKQSKWYNLTSNKYSAPGIVVGNDSIEPDEKIINAMKRMGVTVDTPQIKNYITNNRHNNVTAFYYLLKKKAQKYPSILEPQKAKQQEKRSESPLMYKPQHKKEYYMQTKGPQNKQHLKMNDSFNASTIVSSLVQANKNKIISNINNPNKINKKIETFEKVEEFKLFPKHKNSSQYDPQSPLTPIAISVSNNPNKAQSLTSRSNVDDNRLVFHTTKIQETAPQFKAEHTSNTPSKQIEQKRIEELPPHITIQERNIVISDKRQVSSPKKSLQRQQLQIKNKRRQELSDQLKQISLKIDKQITELRKHNNNNMTTSMMADKRRESFTFGIQPPVIKLKSSQHAMQMSDNFSVSKPVVGISQERVITQTNENSKLTVYKEVPTKFPKMHFGPFNAQCLLMEAPRTILIRIADYLTKLSIMFKQADLFTLRLQTNDLISVESIHGINGYHIVKFSNNTPLTESIIQFLSQ